MEGILSRTNMPGLYKAADGGLFFMDDFGFPCRVSLDMGQKFIKNYINGMAALAGQSY